ncbi:MAG TPA: glycosyltransferase [Fimbriimonas sp.]|nr:glycosyltransferase [Fimbriimonas sp.]
MAKFLFAPIPFTGHVAPGLPIARELIERGHSVRWYTTHRFKSAVEKIGATYLPMSMATELDEARLNEQFPERSSLKGLNQLRYDIKRVFIDQVPPMLEDVTKAYKEDPADVVVGDNLSGVAAMLSERFEIPWGTYGISVLGFPSLDAPPFGLNIIPGRSPVEKIRNRLLNWAVDHIVFKDSIAHFHAMRATHGFPRINDTPFTFARRADVYLQCGVSSFEYPRSDLPKNVRFIGAFVPSPPSEWKEPAWWPRLDSGRPVILITQGTIANDYDELIRPGLRALKNEDATIIVTTGSNPPEAVDMPSLPENVIVEQFVPYAHLMPKVDLLLTNGGYGSVQIALTHGVPVLAFGASEDKAEIANRISWSGVGLGIRTKTPTGAQILRSVREILGSTSYKERAAAMRKELAECDAAQTSGDLLEQLLPIKSRLKRLASTM